MLNLRLLKLILRFKFDIEVGVESALNWLVNAVRGIIGRVRRERRYTDRPMSKVGRDGTPLARP